MLTQCVAELVESAAVSVSLSWLLQFQSPDSKSSENISSTKRTALFKPAISLGGSWFCACVYYENQLVGPESGMLSF